MEVREVLYIDSGLPLINASAEEIRLGLLEDARSMRAWMPKRLGVIAQS